MIKNLLKNLFTIVVGVFILINAQASEKLYVYNWTEYVPNELLKKFTQETGIEVVYTTFESNEEMYSKLKLTNTEGYDLVFPSSYYVQKMANEGMLHKIDKTKISNIDNVTPELMHKNFDPQNEYSLPYIFGLTGILANKTQVNIDNISSWADLWNPEYKGQISLMNDAREVFHMALILKGFSPNTTNEDEIKQAYDYLTQLIPNVQTFNSDSPEVPFVQEEVNLGMSWNGSSFRGMQENTNLQFIYPKEGAILWIDCMAITKHAKNIDGAYKFIEFLLRPENAKVALAKTGFSMANTKLKDIVEENMQHNNIIFPDKANLANSILQEDVGSAIDIYEKYWNKLRTMSK